MDFAGAMLVFTVLLALTASTLRIGAVLDQINTNLAFIRGRLLKLVEEQADETVEIRNDLTR